MKFYSLASGSSGNCSYLEFDNERILVDAGISCKKITQSLKEIGVGANSISAVMVTHEHLDHIKGLRVLSRKYNLPVYATEKTWLAMEQSVIDIAEHNKQYLDLNGLDINGLKIESFSISHDAADPVGYCFFEKDIIAGMATDTGYITEQIKKYLTGADYIYIEANHDIEMLKEGNYPWHLKRRILSNRGHLSNVDSGMGLTSLISGKTKKVTLAHLSDENNLPGLARQTVERILSEVQIKTDINIAQRDRTTELYNETEDCHGIS